MKKIITLMLFSLLTTSVSQAKVITTAVKYKEDSQQYTGYISY